MKNLSSSKLIAKNTLMLYVRQIFIMFVSLYTVRVVLNILGSEDYGCYNVIAGVVVLFSFINSTMATSTQRFLNFSLGENDINKVNRIYTSSLIIHLGISLLFVLISETIGLYFVAHKLNIPLERKNACNIVYQITIINSVFNILKVPYNAIVIAYEKMAFFAWTSIIEVFLKLILVFIIKITSFDKLVIYALLLAIISLITLLMCKIYCNKKFEIAHFHRHKDFGLFTELLLFSGWSLFGGIANICNTQGINIVLNIYTNVIVNAAMGIANQVNNAIYSFVTNFQTAFNPQLIKNYAASEHNRFLDLLNKSAKFSFFLLYLIFLPLYINVEYVLTLWLKNPPGYSVLFVKLILIWSLIDVFNNPLYIAIQATGNIKTYNIVVSIMKLLPLPIIILLFRTGFPPEILFYTEMAFSLVINPWRVFYCGKRVGLNIRNFFINIILKCLIIVVVTCTCMFFIKKYLVFYNDFFVFLIICILSVLLNFICFYLVGMDKNEKLWISNFILSKLKRGA